VKLREKLRVKPGTTVRLADVDPEETHGAKKHPATHDEIPAGVARLDELQYRMYAERKHALLVVLQGIDAAGKDGTIRHVMTGFNPQGCRVTPFKVPTPEEASHDFLWRVHRAVPGLGDVAIFNRSHYEDVLIARVHDLVPKRVWERRYEEINRFEAMLAANGVTIVKFFLYISKDEQKERFQARIDDPTKHWKISLSDFSERKRWDDYLHAYEDALNRCSTDTAPWYVIPANKKWFRNLAVSQILVETLEDLEMQFPEPTIDVSKIKID